MNIPITQSREWQKLQDDLGETSFFKKESDFQYLAILKSTPVGKYLYLPYGPVAKDKTSFKLAFKSLNQLAKEHNAIFIRVEPQNPAICLPKNAIKSKDLNPKDTWVLDLSQDKAEIISGFSQGTRTRYNTYEKKGLKVESTQNVSDIKYLVKLQHKLAKIRGIHAYDENYLKTELKQPFSTLYLVKYEDHVIAASLFFNYGGTRYYMQSAADQDYKKLPATVALLANAIFDAKEQGIKKFDFWGIAPENADKSHPWYGFTEFKKSFGGSELHYAGTYDIPTNNFKYHIYQLVRKANRFIRKIH